MALENYQFGDAVQAAYDFWLYQLCDVYLEVVKPRLPGFQESLTVVTPKLEGAIYALNSSFSVGIRLLHPIMPYITEELYHHLPDHIRSSESICVSQFPTVNAAWDDASVDDEMQLMKSAVHSLRSLSVTLGIAVNANKDGFLVATEAKDSKSLDMLSGHIATLAKFKTVCLHLWSCDFGIGFRCASWCSGVSAMREGRGRSFRGLRACRPEYGPEQDH